MIPPVSSSPPINWTMQQRVAIENVGNWALSRASRFFALTGPAGSGKTTVLRAVQQSIGEATWAAMTGKAAARMKQASGLNAKTLHSALYHAPDEIDNIEERRIDLKFNEIRQDEGGLLIIDEASMITAKVRQDIEQSNYYKILVVGDPYQLPPVEDDYSIFTGTPGAALTEVMRTAGAVLHAATVLRETDMIHPASEEDSGSRYDFELHDNADSAFLRTLNYWLEDREDHVILTWKNKNRMHMNRTIRERLGIHDAEKKDDRMPQPGEPIVICQNIHDQNLMNGDVVRVQEWLHHGPAFSGTDRENRPFHIETRWCRVRTEFGYSAESEKNILVMLTGSEDGMFDGKTQYVGLENMRRAVSEGARSALKNERGGASIRFATPITYAYCLTAHKAQGSQYRRVTTYVPGDLRSKNFQKQTRLPNGDAMSFSTRWLYTAISRAVKHSSLIVSR